MKPHERPAQFNRWQSLLNGWDRWLEDNSLAPLHACLGFALAQPEITRIVVGVDSLTQLKEILGTLRGSAVVPPVDLCSDDSDLINPSRWNVS